MKPIIFSLVFLVLSACSTVSLPISQLSQVTTQYVFVTDETINDSGTLILARDKGMVGSAARVHVFVDGQNVGILKNGEYISIRLSQGRHLVKTQTKTVLDDGYRPQSVDVEIKSGLTSVIRVGFEASGQPAMWLDN